MRIRALVALPALIALVCALVVAPLSVQPSVAGVPTIIGGAECVKYNAANVCTIVATVPVDTEGTRDPVTGFTPAPPVCAERSATGEYKVIPCEFMGGWWSNSRQCYVKYGAVQGAPLISPDPAGAWYDCLDAVEALGLQCTDEQIAADPRVCDYLRFRDRFFSLYSPPGITVMAPGQAAAIFAASFPLNPITIGLAPDPNVDGSRSYVGVPVWMWAENPTPDTFGPYTESGTVGGLNITATATVTSLLWTMGDGSTVACATGGTPYDPGLGFTDSPNCGHRYSQTSASQPGNRFPITATSQWDVVWAVGEVGGTINVTTVAESSVEVRELQSVNVGN
jgi:hypothetical protein